MPQKSNPLLSFHLNELVREAIAVSKVLPETHSPATAKKLAGARVFVSDAKLGLPIDMHSRQQ
jgi:hypothetical protein